MTDWRVTTTRLLPFTLAFVVAALTLYLLVQGRDLLIPFAIAIVVWYLINAAARGLRRMMPAGVSMPEWLSLSIAVVLMGLGLWLLGTLLGGSLSGVSAAAGDYQRNLDGLIGRFAGAFGFDNVRTMADMFDKVDFNQFISRIAETAANIAGRAGIIIVYVIFLLVEQQSFERKLSALFPDEGREHSVRQMLSKIQADVQTYVWIKTVMSVLTGAVSYAVLVVVGVDFAPFWAVIIFFLNYIPTIGSLLGVVFPALLALIQFDTLGPFLVVAAGLGAAQFFIGNVLEPKLMGNSLNLSPLVVILSLALWGQIWGIVGMFLSVPIMVILMIIFAHFQPTRPIAIVLSSNGRIEDYLDRD